MQNWVTEAECNRVGNVFFRFFSNRTSQIYQENLRHSNYTISFIKNKNVNPILKNRQGFCLTVKLEVSFTGEEPDIKCSAFCFTVSSVKYMFTHSV